jgi:hypothetical protein
LNAKRYLASNLAAENEMAIAWLLKMGVSVKVQCESFTPRGYVVNALMLAEGA